MLLILPGYISPDNPVVPLSSLLGKVHSGPGIRGKNKNSMMVSGMANRESLVIIANSGAIGMVVKGALANMAKFKVSKNNNPIAYNVIKKL